MLIAGAVIVIAAGGTAAFFLWPANDPPPPNPATAQPEEVTKYLASEQFAKLPVEKKQAYFEEIHRKSPSGPRRVMRSANTLTEKEREQLHENMGSMFQARMREEMDRYFELPPEDRTAYLDEMIDRHEQHGHRPPPPPEARRAAAGNESSADGGPGDHRGRRHGRGPHHRNPEHIKRRIEHTSAKDHARFMEFMEAMRKRREERGLGSPGRRR